MISPSVARKAVRGFWPGLGAKSWASAGMAANQVRCCSLAAIQVRARPVQVNLGRICWMDVGLLGLKLARR